MICNFFVFICLFVHFTWAFQKVSRSRTSCSKFASTLVCARTGTKKKKKMCIEWDPIWNFGEKVEAKKKDRGKEREREVHLDELRENVNVFFKFILHVVLSYYRLGFTHTRLRARPQVQRMFKKKNILQI